MTLSVDDLLGSYSRLSVVMNGPGLVQTQAYRFNRRAVMLGFSWSFDGAPGKAPAAPTIDYNSGAGL
jgi:hypothetical protein